MRKALVGLPGLYQNWVLTTMDPDAEFRTIKSNFKYRDKNDSIVLFQKIQETLDNPAFFDDIRADVIVNLYVREENFIWYLKNFLGKTDEHFLDMSNLLDEFESKSLGTQAFESLYQHYLKSYEITQDSSKEYRTDSLIEFFYLGFMSADNHHKNIAKITMSQPNSINVEYRDFDDPTVLEGKLSPALGITHDVFADRYQQLLGRNQQYLNQPRLLRDKISVSDSILDMDILDQSVVGYFISKLTGINRLDWFNKTEREDLYSDHRHVIVKLLNGY